MSISSRTQARLKSDNPRQLKGKRYKKLHDDLKEFGDLSGVVYNITTGQTIGGNQRSAVFDIGECKFEFTHESAEPDEQGTLKLGYVIWRGNRYGYREVAWPKEREDAACLIANIGAGEWDWDRLAAYDAEILQIAGMDANFLKTLENDERNLRAMLEAANERAGEADAEPQIDRAEELNEKWQVKSGDLFEIGPHRLLCGDSTRVDDAERVTGGETAGAVVTDPPYGIGIQSTSTLKNKAGGYYDAMNNSAVYTGYYRQWIDLVKNGLIWCFINWRTFPVLVKSVADLGYSHESVLIWDKEWIGPGGNKGLRPSYEMATLLCVGDGKVENRGVPDIFRCQWSSHKPTGHQAEKPVKLIEHIVKTCAGDIFDPFGGSGTTMVACENLGRKCRMIELSPNFCAVILERMTTAFPTLAIHRVE